MIYKHCQICQAYAERRVDVLPAALANARRKTGESSQQIIDRYMTGVHDRHMAGLSLAVHA